MHERMRPSGGCTRELDLTASYHEFMEQQWDKLAAEKFKEWKLKQRSLPRCPMHEGRWGAKDGGAVHVSLEVVLVKVPDLVWLRELWWVCPGAPEGWMRHAPAGFGG
jgi:hypothetical protein